MNDKSDNERPRKRLINHDHHRRPLRYWVVSLLVIVAIIIFLPRLLAVIE